jgi:hypothetical protein
MLTLRGRVRAKAMMSADVLGADGDLRIELAALFGSGMGDVVGKFGRDGAGLDEDDAAAGLEFLPQGFRPPVEAPFGCCVSGVAGVGGAAGDGGDVDQVAPVAVAQSVEEHFGGGHGAEQVHLGHLA